MATLIGAQRIEKEKRINAILSRSNKEIQVPKTALTVLLAFSKELEDLLSASTGLEFSPGFVDKLENLIQKFPHNLGTVATTKHGELDKTGTALWNLSARLKRSNDLNNQQTSTILAMVRLYALLMLDCAHSRGKGGTTNIARMMKVALKTAKHCLGAIYLANLPKSPISLAVY
jgi:hypothetical protein